MTTPPPPTLQSLGIPGNIIAAIKNDASALYSHLGNNSNVMSQLQTVFAKSPLLLSLFQAFVDAGGTWILGAPGGGTSTIFKDGKPQITLDPKMLANLLQAPNTGLVQSGAPSQDPPKELYNLALMLAHELGHAMVPGGGGPDNTTLNNPNAAIAQGEMHEGTAITTAYVVARQLGVPDINGYAGVYGALKKANGADPRSATTAAQLTALGAYSTWVNVAGPMSDSLQPSGLPLLDYKTKWVDEWLLSNKLGISIGQVDEAHLAKGQITDPYDATAGWTFSGTNIALLPSGTATVNYTSSAGETFSFAATEGNDNVFKLQSETWALNGAATVVGGSLVSAQNGNITSEKLVGLAGTDVYYLDFGNVGLGSTNPASATVQISCNASGQGGLYTYSAFFTDGVTQVDTKPYIAKGRDTVTGHLQWTNPDKNGETLEFTPSAPGSDIGTLVITNFAGTKGADVELNNFNLQMAEGANGFLGLHIQQNTALNVTTGPQTLVAAAMGFHADAALPSNPAVDADGGGGESITLSVDVAPTTAETFTVTLSGALASDFEVLSGGTLESIGPNDTFNIVLAAGETSTAFELVDVAPNDGSSDLADGGTVTLKTIAPGSGSDTTGASTVTLDYSPSVVDTTQPPSPSSFINGVYNSATSITSYNGDGGDDIFTGTGTKNLINAASSNNDVITGGSGTNTIIGSSGNDVINLSGTNDQVSLGGGFSTVNGGAGLETIYGGGGTAVIIGNGGSDLIFGGNGTNEIYVGQRTTLDQAISNTRSAARTSGQGDLIGVLDGDNTVVGGSGDDYIAAASGNDVIVLGSGDDTFIGGSSLTEGSADWYSVTNKVGANGVEILLYGGSATSELFTNSFPQPYNGSYDLDTGDPDGPSNDTIYTGNGNDLLFLGNGANAVELGSGTDTVFGGMGDDTIFAGSGNDYLEGGGGNTYIQGGSGIDTLVGGDGNNTLIAGSGNTTLYAAYGPGGQNYSNANLSQNLVVGGSGKDLIIGSYGLDTLVAGSGDTTIVGGAGNEYIAGGSGKDLLQAGSGSATLVAGTGLDTIFGGTGIASTYVIYGGDGSSNITGGSGSNLIYAGDGGTTAAPTMIWASQSDSAATTTIFGGTGVDYLEGGAGNSVIYGGAGENNDAPDTIFAMAGATTIYGGSGTEFIGGGSGTDLIYAGDGGTDTAPTTVEAGSGIATIYGGTGTDALLDTVSGQDLIVGGYSNNTIVGIGNDTLVAGTGYNLMQANGGEVTVEFNAGFGDSTVDAGGGTVDLVFGPGISEDDIQTGVGFDQNHNSYLVIDSGYSSIYVQNGLTGGVGSIQFAQTQSEDLFRAMAAQGGASGMQEFLSTALGADAIYAFGSNDFVIADQNNDLVTAGDYQDTISSWGANSTLKGATGGYDQTYIYSAGNAASIVAGTGADSIVAAGDNDSITTGPNHTYVTVTGGYALVTGTTGQDVITLSGTADTVVAGSGNSQFVVNDSSAVIQAGAGAGVDSIVSSVSYTAPTNVNVLTLTGSANIAATGNAGADKLTSGSGNDTLIAGSGLATLIGGSGNTTFVVDNTGDVVQDGSSTTNNQILSSVSYTLPTNVNTLVLTGTAGLVGRANSGNDTLISNSGPDTLYGGSGHDTFIITNTADVIVVGTGTTTIIYESSAGYTLPGGALTLTLAGTANLVGTADGGNDTLISNSGVDTLYGGAGNDTFVINNSADVIVDTSATASNVAQSSVSFSLPTDVNSLILTGTAALTGIGNAATNLLQANSGNDTLISGTGITTLVAGAGSDVFVVNNTQDVVKGVVAGSDDTIVSSVSYSLPANVDTLVFTGTGSVTGYANSDNDTLISNSGVDTLVGGTGAETYVINNSSDVVRDSATFQNSIVDSSVSYTLPTNVYTLILTGTGNIVGSSNGTNNESLVGGVGQDTLVAASGFDTLVAGTGATTLVAYQPFELFVVNSTADVVTVLGGVPTTDTIASSVSYSLPFGIGTLQLLGTADLIGTGADNGSVVVANEGNDILYAGGGRETLVAGSGIDTLVQGTGADTFVINSTLDVLQGVLATVGDAVVSSVSYTLPTSINILTLSGKAALLGVGNNNNDVLTAGDGNDTLIAGSGVTTLVGGIGADLFVIGNSADVVSNPDAQESGRDTIQSSVSYTLPTAVDILVLTGTANLIAGGNQEADSIVGNAGLDTLEAGLGNDTLVAGAGLATLIGGRGNDTFVINNTGDVIVDTFTGENNVLVSSVSYSLPTGVNTFLVSGFDDVVARGNAGNDLIKGNGGADTLIAGAGNDTLVAGSGPATLIGGSGNDTFIVNSSADVVVAGSGGSNVLLSSGSFVLPTNFNEIVLTGASNVSATGNASNDTLIAGPGNDTLVAGSGVDTMIGGSGGTTFVINSTADVVIDTFASVGNEIQSSVNYSLPTDVNTLIFTGTGNLAGIANSGPDTLVSNSGVDTFTGGSGPDTFLVNNSGDVLLVSAGNSDTVEASVNYVLPANLGLLVLTGTGNLVGGANGGTDTIISNSGIDTLVAGAGNDTFVINNPGDVVVDSAGSGSAVVISPFSYSLPTNVNTLTLTGTAALVGTGNGGGDLVTGNLGADTLVSGSGQSTLVGKSGADLFFVNNTADVVVESSTILNSTIESSVSYSLPSNVDVLQMTGTANVIAVANSGNDTLISNSGVDTIVAGSGNDVIILNNPLDVVENVAPGDTVYFAVDETLNGSGLLALAGTGDLVATGGSGNDTLVANVGNDTLIAGSGPATLIGGPGNDVFVVNNPLDVVIDSYASTSSVILSSVSYTLPTNVDELTLTGTAALSARGNNDFENLIVANGGSDVLFGSAFSNTLIGGSGRDYIQAGAGTNLLYAGDGGTASNPTEVLGNTAQGAYPATTMYGGAGVDYFAGGSGSDLIVTGTGASTIRAGSGYETINAINGTSQIFGSGGYSLIYAGAGSSEIIQGSGTNVIYGGAAGTTQSPVIIDWLNGNDHNHSTIFGGSGVENIYAGSGSHVIYGGTGYDLIYGGYGADTVYGGAGTTLFTDLFGTLGGHELLVGGSGDSSFSGRGYDTIVGGTGHDVFETGSYTGTIIFNQGFGQETIAAPYGDNVGNITFGPGIDPDDLTLTSEVINDVNQFPYLALVMSDGAGSILITGALNDNASHDDRVGPITFADTGVESFAQLVEADDTQGTLVLPYTAKFSSGDYIVSTGDHQSMTADGATTTVSAFGNNDTINGGYASIYAYGDHNVINSNGPAYLVTTGNYDLVTDGFRGNVTLGGANTTLIGAGQDSISVYASSDVVVESTTSALGGDTLAAYASFNLPQNVTALILESASLVGGSNSTGGVLTATSNYDTLVGGAGADTLVAQGTNDVLVGGSGAEVYILTSATDTVDFGSGPSTVEAAFSYTLPAASNGLMLTASGLIGVGNSANDLLMATAYDTLVAGSGNDTLTANYPNNTLIGGSGTDTFMPRDSTDVIIENYANTNSVVVLTQGGYSLPTNVNIMKLTGTTEVGTGNSGNDLITDTSEWGRNTLVGGSGNDTLVVSYTPALDPADTLVAGTGNDLMVDSSIGGLGTGSATTFLFNPGFGNDEIVTGRNNDVIKFGTGITPGNLTFGAAIEPSGPSLVISAGADSITVDGGLLPGVISSIQFASGASYSVAQLIALSGRVTVAGATGNLIYSAINNDSIAGGSGQDTIFVSGSGDSVTAGPNGSVIYAGGANDQVSGGAGRDTLTASGTGDTLIGGSGQESFVVEDTSTVVNVSAGVGNNTVYSWVNYTVPDNVTVLNLMGTASLTATGNGLNDLITGTTGGDVFIAGSGIDTFVGYASFNQALDATTTDVFQINNTSDVIEASGQGGFSHVTSTVSYSLPQSVSWGNLDLEAGNIVATANNGNILLSGGIYIFDENDTFVSGTGVDTFGQHGANSVLVINNSADRIDNVVFGDTLMSGVSATVGGVTNLQPEPYYGLSTWNLTGSADIVADDASDGELRITGNAGNDTLIAFSGGYDMLVAGSGIDTLIGGANGGVTTFVINNAADVVIAQASASGNIVESFINYTLQPNITQLVLEATGLVGQGNGANGDTLTAFGNDTLIAGSGTETLQSATGNGANTLIAGSGADDFQAFAGDTIVFNPGFGQAEVANGSASSAGAAILDFGTGITPAGLTAMAGTDSAGDPSLVLSTGSGSITLDGALGSKNYQFEFGGGSPMTLAQLLSQVTVTDSSLAGGSGNIILEGSGSQLITAGSGNDTIYAAGLSDTIVGGAGSQLLVAMGVNDSVIGGSAADTLEGLGTNDTLVAGSVVDTLVGGTGATVEFVINNTGDRVQVQTNPGADTVASSVNYSLPANVTTLILTAAGLRGQANSTGADTLISSTAGIDTLVGGNGNDTFVLNVSGDVVTDSSASAHNTVRAGFSYSLPTDINTLVLTGTSAVAGTGNTAADLVVGNLGSDTLTAVGTNATALMGGGGTNVFVVVNSKDVVVESFTGTNDTILSSASFSLPQNVDILTLTGTTAALSATGNADNDVITAAALGVDTLTAGSGIATLIGGGGSDVFVVNNTNDVVQVTATGLTDTILSTVSYVLPANVVKLTLQGSQGLSATGNSLNDTLTANSGNDTLIAGSGTDVLVGGAGADLFVINSTADTVSVSTAHTNDTIQSSVTYSAPANVANLTLTGSGNINGTGSSTLAGVLTANNGSDVLTGLAAGTTLVGGAGNDAFSINSSLDVIIDTFTNTTNTLNTSASFTLPTNVNILNVTGTGAVMEVGNGGNDSLTANNAADTLVASGSGSDTLVSGTGVDSLVGNLGTDVFVVKNSLDKVTVGTLNTNDTIQSSVSFTLPTNLQYLVLTGTASLAGGGNTLTDLIIGNSGADTLTGGTGIAVLEGGSGTGAKDVLKAPGAQGALIAGGGASTLTGAGFKDFFAAGAVSDSITTGATANVIAVNKGDGATTLAPTTGASDVLSLGAGIDTENLTFTKSGNNLILNDAVTGDSITFTNWYSATANQVVKTLQVVEAASSSYNASGTDPLRNKPIEEFNFTTLFNAYNTAGSPANWTLAGTMSSAALASSSTSAYGGDLAYYFGLNGNLTGMSLSAAQSTLTNSNFGTAPQTIDSWSSISGGGGLQLAVAQKPALVDPIQLQWMTSDASAQQESSLAGSEAVSTSELPMVTTLLGGGGATGHHQRIGGMTRPRIL